MKILIVDDEQDVEIMFLQKFRREIKSKLLEVEFAFSGQEALEYLERSGSPDVVYVFSDINMPGMSGLELLENIKSRFPHIQVSMISAYGDKENYNKAIKSGAKGFFTKPVDFESLKNEIAELLTDK
ncbi:Response regulator receiver domain-containing protein [Algoriphagus alkaliphilus]|uniref:Response regulator receiver domain-containing protein n=1 Tax=Algoriphagus alkaliphilus TaxID=279824 RepID=A0A1G5YYB5_9BACT|nr:response regulator [Algoriphagus alkaliphilus]MBA4300943.1 response regulator [Cyclobacterium sp.]SDA87444.1 Response regulator receiver domain-containing protein [Algoriphagus alkaliphilus]